MLFDPILQNGVFVNLFAYLVKKEESGGCYTSPTLFRATLTLVIFYCIWHLVNTVVTTLYFARILKATPEGGINNPHM